MSKNVIIIIKKRKITEEDETRKEEETKKNWGIQNLKFVILKIKDINIIMFVKFKS